MNAEVENVVLHFFGKTGYYIETKPLHGSQKSKWLDEGLLEVNLKVMLNYELENMMHPFGDSVVVIKPVSQIIFSVIFHQIRLIVYFSINKLPD